MKCDKHGIEMEWRGSLAAGRMHCDHCANAGGTAAGLEFGKRYDTHVFTPEEIAKALGRAGQPQFGFDPGTPVPDPYVDPFKVKKAAPDPYPKGAAPSGAPLTPTGLDQVRHRLKLAKEMQERHYHGREAYCPYCGNSTPPSHTQRGSGPCFDAYMRDDAEERRSRQP